MVDDDPSVLSSLKRVFRKENYLLYTASGGHDALRLLQTTRIDAALLDLKMPGMDGLTLLKTIRKEYPTVMAVILTGEGDVKKAVQAIKLGAHDFLEKPFSNEKISARIAQLYRIWELQEENRNLKAKIEFQFGFDRLIGNSTAILKLKRLIAQLGPSDTSVLIQGETGTGKELVARAIHHHSPRARNNFVPVDCAAISETVIESELFGHVKGAFTGAYASSLGLIRSADKGTLFLDEVGELSIKIQVKLLRTIQEREVRPVGGNEPYQVDVRIVAATNRDLAEEVAKGQFREDLFYRLNVVTLSVPTLQERKEDISLMAKYFVKKLATDLSPVEDISKEALLLLESYHWPGNVRELENVIHRAMALATGNTIMPQDLPQTLVQLSGQTPQSIDLPSDDSLAAYEKAAIQNALSKSKNNRKKAAQTLGIGEATLYRKMNKYQLKD